MGRHVENSCQDPNLIENKRKMIWSLFLITVILIAKLTGAFFTRSLALLSDSWHLVTDLTSLLISYWGLRMAAIPATHKYTFGHHRHGIFTALINNFSLIAVSIFIFYKAVMRFLHPVTVEPKGMIILALLGLVVNCIIVINLKDSKNLNIRSAFLHFVGDALADVGVLTGGMIIYFTGWIGIDTLLSAILASLILGNAVKMSLECITILLEGNLVEFSIEDVKQAILSISGVLNVTDLHLWSLSAEIPIMTCHICMAHPSIKNYEKTIHEIQHLLHEKFGIRHSTIQLESTTCGSCYHSKSDHQSACSMCIDSTTSENCLQQRLAK
jgi:cobalt-zinc-cadmium efflux system protein